MKSANELNVTDPGLFEKIIKYIRNRNYLKLLILLFWEIIPNVSFWWVVLKSIDLRQDIQWAFVLEHLPSLFYGLMTGLLFLLYIHAQSAYYEVRDTTKWLARLNQLYKERFKMIKFGDTDKLLTQDFERNLWRNRLLLKEPGNWKEIDAFLADNYGYTHIDYNGKSIPIKPASPK